MAFIDRGNITIHYQWLNRQRDDTLILINSLGTNLMIWADVVPQLLDTFNILLFDKRGHGLSSTQPGDLSMDDYADDVIHLMDALTIRKAHILGLSIGGLITYSLATRYPDRFDRLIFSNTGAKLGTAQAWNERIVQIEKDGIPSISDQIIKLWFSAGFRESFPAQTKAYKGMLEGVSQLGYIQACGAIGKADYRQPAGKIRHRVLFIGGSEDLGTPPGLVKESAGLTGAERVEIMEGVGHLPCIEKPVALAALIQDFLVPDPHPPEMLSDAYRQGMATRRRVLGDAHVDRAEATKTDFDKDFQEYIVHTAWQAIWSRPGLSKRDRSLITIALLAALGHDQELAMHIRATRNTGATEEEVREVLMQAGLYAGVPVANNAIKIAKKVFEEMRE